MSVAVVKVYPKKVVLGTDSAIIYNNSMQLATGFKIKKANDLYFAYAGVFEEAEMNFAMTALCLGKSVKTPIEVACRLSPFCAKPANVIEIGI